MSEKTPAFTLTRRNLLRGRRNIETVDQNLTRVIEQELGIGPDRVQLSMVFNNHILDSHQLTDIANRRVDVVMGEFLPETIREIIKIRTVDVDDDARIEAVKARLLRPGEGASYQERRQNIENIQRMLQNGITMGVLDVEQVSSEYDSAPSASITPGVALLGSFVMAGALPAVAANAIAANRHGREPILSSHPTRRTVLKWGAGAATLIGLESLKHGWGMAGVDLGKRRIVPRDIPTVEGRNIPDINTNILDTTYEQVRLALGIDKVAFESYIRTQVDFRNKIMALNSWNTIARYGDVMSGDATRIYFTAGLGHGRVYHEFLSGIDRLEAEIGQYAQRLSTESLNFLIRQADILETQLKIEAPDIAVNPDEDVANEVTRLASMFGRPVLYGKKMPNFAAGSKRQPQTPQTILIETMRDTLNHLRQDKSAEARRKAGILETVLNQITGTIKNANVDVRLTNYALTGDRNNNQITASQEDIFEANNTFYSPYSVDTSRADTMAKSCQMTVLINRDFAPDDRMFIGAAKYRGQYHPVYRDFAVDATGNTLFTHDRIFFDDGSSVLLNSGNFNRISGVEELTHQDRVIMERITYEGSSPWFNFAVRSETSGIAPTQRLNKEIITPPQIGADVVVTEVSNFFRRDSDFVDKLGVAIAVVTNRTYK